MVCGYVCVECTLFSSVFAFAYYTLVLFCTIIWTLFVCFGGSPAGSKVKKDDDGSSVCKEVKGIVIVIG